MEPEIDHLCRRAHCGGMSDGVLGDAEKSVEAGDVGASVVDMCRLSRMVACRIRPKSSHESE